MLQRLEQLPFGGSCDWDTPLLAWQYYQETLSSSAGVAETVQPPLPDVETTPSIKPVDTQADATCDSDSLGAEVRLSSIKEKPVTFRVTCTRGGRKHCFTSMDAARSLGAGLARRFGWTVQLKKPSLEVLLTIVGDDVTVAVALNQESKYKRNITHFGPTTLRSTIAYGLLRYQFRYTELPF